LRHKFWSVKIVCGAFPFMNPKNAFHMYNTKQKHQRQFGSCEAL
jgi:hypothetical protein